jgi:hypothetical protein
MQLFIDKVLNCLVNGAELFYQYLINNGFNLVDRENFSSISNIFKDNSIGRIFEGTRIKDHPGQTFFILNSCLPDKVNPAVSGG